MHPYTNLTARAYWSRTVATSRALVPEGLYELKWPISKEDRIATAGSCFAQHIGRNLRKRGFQVMDMEPPPESLSPEQQGRFGYSIYSARFGNIYTVRQLLQLAQEAFGLREPDDIVWTGENGSFFDALRPGVEPLGLGSVGEVIAHREYHLARVRKMFETMDIFIFTMGLTEAWEHKPSGTVYPTAPGTIAGSFDETVHGFRNFRFQEILEDFQDFRTLIRERRGDGRVPRMLLTVSPVPLTATASGKHVMVATVQSKSVLRAVAGQVSEMDDVDYFPSYEIITNPWSKASFYEPNQRSVKSSGVDEVMNAFFTAHAPDEMTGDPVTMPDGYMRAEVATDEAPGGDLICEEALLEAFGEAARK
ncbi:MAG: GSCFA family protein [Verrucomicrobiaceae bacterium]|nr:MAG: GSCFA family protein [Verrucomicrobiaceae bacterium]